MIRPRYSQGDQPSRPSKAFIDQVAREVLRMQREVYPRGTDPRGKGHQYAQVPFSGAMKAIVTTAISAASGTVYGSGAAQIYYSSTPEATLGTADADVTSNSVNNWYTNSGTIAVGTHCWVFAADSSFWLLGCDC